MTLTRSFERRLRKNLYLEMLGGLLEDPSSTGIDAAIRNALYWIGEAQHDGDATAAFVKFWIAMEALITGRRQDIGERLGRTVAVLLAFAGYEFIGPAKVAATRRDVKRLYDKRCDIVHRGMIDRVGPDDLRAACEYAARSLLCTLALRADGFRDRRVLQAEIDRVYGVAAGNHQKSTQPRRLQADR